MKNSKIIEKGYDISRESYYGTIFTTSNGYMGVRGSFEENGSMSVQGTYIRGLIDEIPFNQSAKIDSEYMRKYYINEDKAKAAEVQEGVINIADFLFMQFEVNGEVFYPWEGKILKWERTLDMEKNVLTRKVRWQNSKGDITEFEFVRFASFANDHIYADKISVTPINHNHKITVTSGIDLRTKSGGFKMCTLCDTKTADNQISLQLETKGKYHHKINIGIDIDFAAEDIIKDNEFVAGKKAFCGSFTLEKKVYIITTRDDGYADTYYGFDKLTGFDALLKEHIAAWCEFFSKIDIKIEGDDEADLALRFSNFQTAISLPRNDAVHGLAAKGLTGEAYNNYVWWDSEVYQQPVFLYAGVSEIRNSLIYRYERLDEARKAAKAEGRYGARFPFISAVTGEEKVWQHVRHPFMQIHVVADVGWSIINYYNTSGDRAFMDSYGLLMLSEISDYWTSRAEWKNDRLEILGVAGCDEHHPYIDNNAYTNYLAHFVVKTTIELCKEYGKATENKWQTFIDNLYLPMDNTGFIPQFDGYFNLSRTLESVGGGNGFQMKSAGGQYHKSQVIKQPDVMVLFAYMNMQTDNATYQKNWDYYEEMCEAASSLTYPVHAICAADNNQLYKAYRYLMKSATIDLNDLHGGADEGVHSACAAGAYYAIVRGFGGVKMHRDMLEINPKTLPWWKKVSYSICYQGTRIEVSITNEKVSLKPDKDIEVLLNGEKIKLNKERTRSFSVEENKEATI